MLSIYIYVYVYIYIQIDICHLDLLHEPPKHNPLILTHT